MGTVELQMAAIQRVRVHCDEPFALWHQRLFCTVGVAGRVPYRQLTSARHPGWKKLCPHHRLG